MSEKKYPDCMYEYCTCVDPHEHLDCIQGQMNKKERDEPKSSTKVKEGRNEC